MQTSGTRTRDTHRSNGQPVGRARNKTTKAMTTNYRDGLMEGARACVADVGQMLSTRGLDAQYYIMTSTSPQTRPQ